MPNPTGPVLAGPQSQTPPAPGQPRPGGTGPRSNGNSFGPKGSMHRWPCYCTWCLAGTVPEMAG